MNSLARILAQNEGNGYIIAPAGFGKTHLIAYAALNSTGRALILTHTYAGVNALQKKMRDVGVVTLRYQIDTIASWALRLCLSYPKTSGWTVEHPEGNQWTELYDVCTKLLDHDFVGRIIRASYRHFFVDEYQDCSKSQHSMVIGLANWLPCCVLGDPLQGVFDFADEPVCWEEDIYPSFVHLGKLNKPWRWHNAGTAEIGEWLCGIRDKLEKQEQIILSPPYPEGVKVYCIDEEDKNIKQFSTCKYFDIKKGEKVIAIHGGSSEFKNKGHHLARNLCGTFSSIEEIEGNALFSFVKKITNARGSGTKLMHAIDFAAQCMAKLKTSLSAGTRRGETVIITKNTKCSTVTAAANMYLKDPSSDNLKQFFLALKKNPSVIPVRRDLLNRAIHVLTVHSQCPQITLEEAAIKYQSIFRHGGRPISYPKLIGTTLLVKGLEFDHVIVLDAASLSAKELYVALTRGSKSITIITTSDTLPLGTS